MNARGWWNEMRRGFSRDPLPIAFGMLLVMGSIASSLTVGVVLAIVVAFDPSENGMTRWVVSGMVGSLTLFGVFSGATEGGADVADARRLQVYPLRRRELVLLDLLAGALSPMMSFFLPGAAGVAVGVAVLSIRNGYWAGIAAGPVAVLLGLLVGVAIVRIVGTRIALGGRRMRELTGVLVGAIVMSLVFIGPVMQEIETRGSSRAAEIGTAILSFTHAGAAGAIAAGSGSAADWIILLAWVGAALALHHRFATRILDGEGGVHTRARKKPSRRAELLQRFPRLLPAPALGVFTADLRTLSRMPTLWMLLILPGVFGLLIGRPTTPAGDSAAAEMQGQWLAPMAAIGANLLFSVQLFSNVFGPDHGGSALYVLSPAPPWQILLGKAMARFCVGIAQITVFLAALDFRTGRTIGADELLRAAAAWGAAALWISAAGNIMSVRIPFRMSHGMRRERSARQASVLLAQFFVMLLLIPPSMMILGGRALGDRDGYIAGIAATALGGVVLWIASAVWAGWMMEDRGPELVEELSK